MAESKGKRAVVFLSSSSEEEDDNVAAVLLSSDDDEYQDDLEVIKSDGSDDDIGEEEEESDYPNKDQQEDDDDESLCNKIIRLLTENRELDSLKLKDCKAYLRTYGLRLSGNKSVCLQRIKEHWRLKDGNGETLYPRPSFSINCTGDVCKGDVVLFRQKVYEKLRHGRVLGKRIVVGRVVKESYGTAKQQHTFTVEVFWSRGVKKLPPLFPLLVKGRNLYRMRTFRQCWHDEAERLKVLAEKHRRGDAARSERAMRKTQNLISNRGKKCQKEFPSEGRSKMRKTNESKKGRDYVDRLRKTKIQGSRVYSDRQQKDSMFRAAEHFEGYEKFTCPSTSKGPSFQTRLDPRRIHHRYQKKFQQRTAPYPRLWEDRRVDLSMIDYSDHQQKDPRFRTSEHFKGYQKFSFPSPSKDACFQTCLDPRWIHRPYQENSQQRSAPYPCLWEDKNVDPTIMGYCDQQKDSMVRPSEHF